MSRTSRQASCRNIALALHSASAALHRTLVAKRRRGSTYVVRARAAYFRYASKGTVPKLGDLPVRPWRLHLHTQESAQFFVSLCKEASRNGITFSITASAACSGNRWPLAMSNPRTSSAQRRQTSDAVNTPVCIPLATSRSSAQSTITGQVIFCPDALSAAS